MSATPPNTTGVRQDPAELERQADEIRADMDRTLDALERKFAPEQLLDRSLSYLRDHGGELTQTLGDTMRNNPVPVVLTLAGITWLVASSYNSRQPPGQDLSSRFARSGVGQRLQQRAQTARERLQSTAETAREKLETTKESTRERLSSTRSAASGRLSNVAQSARETARIRASQVHDRVYTMMDEQPLVLGALAVAVGAMIGTAIPSSQYENRILGAARDRTLSKAQQLGQEQYDTLKGSLQQQGSQGQSGTSQSGVTETLAGRA
jgi:ElaB/YqjD/DUF883 family membrane-anchored ribosome-binding protein